MKENKRRRWDRLVRLGLLCLLLLLCAGCARDGEDAASGESQAASGEEAAQEAAGEEGQADTQETAGGENGAAPQEPQGGGEDDAPAIDRGNAFLEAGDMEQAAACRPGSARAEFPREAALPALADIYVVSFREERRTYKITAEAGEGGAIVPSAAEAEEGGSADDAGAGRNGR